MLRAFWHEIGIIADKTFPNNVNALADTFNKLNVPFMNIVCIDVELM